MTPDQAFALGYFVRNGIPYRVDAVWHSLRAMGYVANRAQWELTAAGAQAIADREARHAA